MKTTTNTTAQTYIQGYLNGLAKARDILSERANMIDRLLYSDEAMAIKWHATGVKFDAILTARRELQEKARALWEAGGMLYKEEERARI